MKGALGIYWIINFVGLVHLFLLSSLFRIAAPLLTVEAGYAHNNRVDGSNLHKRWAEIHVVEDVFLNSRKARRLARPTLVMSQRSNSCFRANLGALL